MVVFGSRCTGAGGTTSALQTLWDLRKEYRCAVVRNLSEHTCEQILQLYSFGENQPKEIPKPILILCDNVDEEKSNNLVAEMQEKSKHIYREVIFGSGTYVVCVFLFCFRRLKFPTRFTANVSRTILRQELTKQEQSWFKNKYKELENKYREYGGQDPKHLLSFNILKENFDTAYITKTVQELVARIPREKEKLLLKFIALINAFDLESQPLPTSAFDQLMIDMPFTRKGLRYGWRAVANRWESALSPEFLVLLNITSRPAMGQIKAFSIINRLLAKAIIDEILGRQQTVGLAVLEFFNCNTIFCVKSMAQDNLLKIVKGLLWRRNRGLDGRPETKFSLLISHIADRESKELAAQVLEKGYALTEDPYIAQQVARFYISQQMWEQADNYAQKATEKNPNNSKLWDTRGQVYRCQLLAIYNKCVTDPRPIDDEDAQKMVHIALEAMDLFQQEQKISDTEKGTVATNIAGYIGELQTIVYLLDSLFYYEPLEERDVIHKFLVEDNFIPEEIMHWTDLDGFNLAAKMKSIQHNMRKNLTRLFDEQLQLKESSLDEYKMKLDHQNRDLIVKIKEDLDHYFGENRYQVPDSLASDEACAYRRRLLFRLGGLFLFHIFEHKRDVNGEETLLKIRNLAIENVNSEHCEAEDLQAYIGAQLALVTYQNHLPTIQFSEIIKNVNRLYEMRNKSRTVQLEPYLYYTMFQWPRKKRKYYVAPIGIINALKQWKDAYYKKYPRQREETKPYRKKETTIFFLSNGSDMNSVTHSLDLMERGHSRHDYASGHAWWSNPRVMRVLQRFSGILQNDGYEVAVDVEYGKGHKDSISIPTSFPIRKRDWWNKRVYFCIGFSWMGPKAFDVDQSDPTEDPEYMTIGHNVDFTDQHIIGRSRATQPYHSDHLSHRRIVKDLQNIERELKEIRIKEDRHQQGTARLTMKQLDDHAKRKDELFKRRARLIKQRKETTRNEDY